MIVAGSFQTPVFGYLVTTYVYKDKSDRIVDLYLTTITSIVPATSDEIFQNFRKTSMSMKTALLLHNETIDFVEDFFSQ